jgi:hypothetical protein
MWQRVIRMVRCRKLSPSLVAAALAITVASIAGASTAVARNSVVLPNFSAIEVYDLRGTEVTSKIYRSGVNFRAEPAPGVAAIYVASTDKLYKVNGPECVEITGIPVHMVSSPLQLLSGSKVTRKYGGTEIIGSHTCKLENLVVTATDGRTTQFKLWRATDLKGFPVKIELHSDRGQMTTTYRDIVLHTPDAALFVPPNNCIPFEKTYRIPPPGK